MAYGPLCKAALAIASIWLGAANCAIAQGAAEPAPGAGYRINKVILKASGETIYFLRCDDGTTHCAYDWNKLCLGGRPLNADPLKGVGGSEAAFVRDEDGTPVRMFVCVAPD
ncbi:MAG TPA: hypothetical protein VF523_02670 [Burkholderiales bacterium]